MFKGRSLGVGAGLCNPYVNIGTPFLSLEWLKLNTGNFLLIYSVAALNRKML